MTGIHPDGDNPRSRHSTTLLSLVVLLLAAVGGSIASAQTPISPEANGSAPATSMPIYLPLVRAHEGGDPCPCTPTPMATETPPLPATATRTATPTATPTATATETSPPATVDERALVSGLGTSQNINSSMQRLRQYAVDAIYLASQLNGTGTAVTHGTLTIVDNTNVRYDPAPADRLRVLLADGRLLELSVAEIEGNFASAPGDFLGNPHRLTFRLLTGPPVQAPDPNLVMPPNTDVQIVSTLANGNTSMSVAGATTEDDVAYAIDLHAAGTYYFESSLGGVENRIDYRLTGTIEGADLSLRVDERYINELVVVDGQSASLADTEIHNQWTYAGQSYGVDDGLIRRSFRDGYVNVNEIDTRWLARGAILRAGVAVAELGLNLNLVSTPVYYEVVVLAGGQSHLLQRYRLPTNFAPNP